MGDLSNQKFIIAFAIIVAFFMVYIFDANATMNGALIAAFAGAWGYYLGSSSSSSQVRDQVGRALDLVATAMPPPAASPSPGSSPGADEQNAPCPPKTGLAPAGTAPGQAPADGATPAMDE